MLSNDWKLPFNVAIGIHVLVLLGGIYLPGFFKATPKFAEIYTVSIINVADTAPAAQPNQPAKPQAPPKIKPVKPIKAKKKAPIAETVEKPAPAPAPAPAKAVSLKPLKKKRKKRIAPQKPARDLAKERRRKLAEALREEELLSEKARLAREALENERNLFQQATTKSIAPKNSQVTPETRFGPQGRQSSPSANAAERQYYASIISRVHQYWALPISLQSNPNLQAIVWITIARNGQTRIKSFESRSGDRVFDQFVSRTIAAANPLPPIPAALKTQKLEINLRFKPSDIQF